MTGSHRRLQPTYFASIFEHLVHCPVFRFFNSTNHIRFFGFSGLAFECGLHRTFIAHAERQARNISLENIERIAMALEVPVYALLMPNEIAR